MAGRYTGQQLTLESQTFSVHMFSRNKTIEREGSDYSSGAKYFGHRPRLLGRCLRPVRPTPHAELYAGRQKGKDVTENSKKQLRQRKFVQQEA